jgi:hypothetical protein
MHSERMIRAVSAQFCPDYKWDFHHVRSDRLALSSERWPLIAVHPLIGVDLSCEVIHTMNESGALEGGELELRPKFQMAARAQPQMFVHCGPSV